MLTKLFDCVILILTVARVSRRALGNSDPLPFFGRNKDEYN